MNMNNRRLTGQKKGKRCGESEYRYVNNISKEEGLSNERERREATARDTETKPGSRRREREEPPSSQSAC